MLELWSLLGVLKLLHQRQRDSKTQAALQAPQAKSSILEEPPSSRQAKNPAYRADLLVIDVGATTARDGHASTGKPSVGFVVKLATSHLSVEEVQQRKLQIIEVERRAGTNVVNEDLRVANNDGELAMHALTIGKPSVKAIRVDLKVSGKKLTLVVDTGAAVSILSEKIFQQLFSGVKLKPSSLLLRTYTGERMQVLGTLAVKVCYLSQGPFDLELVVVSGDGPCLMGRDWLQVIHLDWSSIAVVSQGASTRAVQAVLDNFQDVFTGGLGTIYPFKATLFVVKDAKPRFHRARPVPFALKCRVEEALNQLEADGVLEKVTHSD